MTASSALPLPAAKTRRRPMSAWTALAIGLTAAGVGMLPWWLHGARLPLQNLWEATVAPEAMPVALLPFSQYELSTLAAVLLVGSAVAGLAARVVRERMSRSALGAVVVGVLAVQAVAIAQTAVEVDAGLRDDRLATAYLTMLVVGSVGVALLGVAVLLAIARGNEPVAAIGLTAAAVAAGPWASQLLLGGGAALSGTVPSGLLTLLAWLPALLVSAVLVWLGLHTLGRVAAAVVSLGVLWFGTALVTAVSAAVGSSVLAGDPGEMLDYGTAVLTAVLTSFSRDLVVVAACAALLGAVVRLVLRAGRQSRRA